MATELGKAYVQIMPSARGISGNISKELNGEMSTAGKGAGGKLVGAMKGVLVGAAIGKVISSAISAGGELEQNLGGTQAVFGDFAKEIQGSAKDAYKNMGVSASDYMATANKMGSLFQGSGMDQQKSLELTEGAMQRAADVASVMGVDMGMAMESVAGAAKGNFTMMDNLGVAMNAASIEAYALEKGINFKWNTASQAEKSEVAMKMFMDRTSQYAGNFAKESEETFSGSLGAMQASVKDLLGAMTTGGDVTNAMKNLGKSAADVLKNVMPMFAGIIEGLPVAIVELFTTAGPSLVQSGIDAIISIADGLGESIPVLIPKIVSAVTAIVQTLVNNAPALIEAAFTLMVALAEGLIAAIPDLLIAIPKIIASVIGGFFGFKGDFTTLGFDALLGLADGLGNAVGSVVAKAKEVASNIISAVKSVFRSNSPSRVFMDIGADLDEGLAIGIAGNIKPVTKAMKSLGRLTAQSYEADIAMNATSGFSKFAGSVGGVISGITNNVTVNNPLPEKATDSVRKTLLKQSYGMV